jgi:hypothetical protein
MYFLIGSIAYSLTSKGFGFIPMPRTYSSCVNVFLGNDLDVNLIRLFWIVQGLSFEVSINSIILFDLI